MFALYFQCVLQKLRFRLGGRPFFLQTLDSSGFENQGRRLAVAKRLRHPSDSHPSHRHCHHYIMSPIVILICSSSSFSRHQIKCLFAVLNPFSFQVLWVSSFSARFQRQDNVASNMRESQEKTTAACLKYVAIHAVWTLRSCPTQPHPKPT